MSSDLVLVESASLRREHMDRTYALDKVKALRLLPDDTHVTTDMLASYYEADANTVAQAVKRNRAELEANGMSVLRGSELRDFKGKYAAYLPSEVMRSSHLAVFSRRAVLNMGMVLRDSVIAKAVRSFLLDAEATQRAVVDLTTPAGVLALAEQFRECAAQLVAAEARAIEGETFKRAIEGGDGLSFREFHKKYFSAVPERMFFDDLYRREWIVDGRGKGLFNPETGKNAPSASHHHPKSKGKPFLYLHNEGERGENGKWEQTRVIRGDQELGLRDALAREGLPPNEQPGLFAIGDAA